MSSYTVGLRRPYLLALPLIAAAVILTVSLIHRTPACAEFLDADRTRLAKYVRARYGVADGTSVEIQSGATLPGSCLRKISVTASSWSKSLALVLSENKRYLVSDASDIEGPVRPTIATPGAASKPVDMAELASSGAPSLGPASAPVTMVVFSDFQCPFCKRFGQSLVQVEPQQKDRLRVVFRQFPLSIHQHAREEAELSACTAVQSQTAFWAVHDFFFSDDKKGAEANPVDDALTLLAKRQDIRVGDVKRCMKNHDQASNVDRDIAMGTKFGVNGTPTIFINGTRFVGAKSPGDLANLIQNQAKISTTASVQQDRKTGGL